MEVLEDTHQDLIKLLLEVVGVVVMQLVVMEPIAPQVMVDLEVMVQI